MSYGSFGQVAAHELTVSVSYSVFNIWLICDIDSMLSIQLAVYTTSKASWSSGGRTLLAMASTKYRSVSSNNIQVCLPMPESIDLSDIVYQATRSTMARVARFT